MVIIPTYFFTGTAEQLVQLNSHVSRPDISMRFAGSVFS